MVPKRKDAPLAIVRIFTFLIALNVLISKEVGFDTDVPLRRFQLVPTYLADSSVIQTACMNFQERRQRAKNLKKRVVSVGLIDPSNLCALVRRAVSVDASTDGSASSFFFQ